MPWWPILADVEKEVRRYLQAQPGKRAALDTAVASVAGELAADQHYIRQRFWRLHEFGRAIAITRDSDERVVSLIEDKEQS